MLAGIITPPIIIAGQGGANLGGNETQYLVSTSLIVSGILSSIQISRFHIYKSPYYVGTGLISVVGTSFAVIPGQNSILSNGQRTSNIIVSCHWCIQTDVCNWLLSHCGGRLPSALSKRLRSVTGHVLCLCIARNWPFIYQAICLKALLPSACDRTHCYPYWYIPDTKRVPRLGWWKRYLCH